MPTTVDKTIKAGGDYTTLQAWEDATPASLVAVDQIWRGLASGAFSGSSGTLLTFSGTAVDATRYQILTTDTGASFRDNANVQTNALRWNSSNGCSITSSGSYGTTINASGQAQVRLSKLQVEATTSKTTCALLTGANMDADGCIFEGAKTKIVELSSSTSTIRNCLVVNRKSAATECVKLAYGSTAINCTFVTPSDLTKPSEVVTGSGAGAVIKNCAMFWGTALQAGGTAPTYTTSGNDNATPPSGVTQYTYNTSLFQNISNATRDYRLPSGSSLIGAGTVDSTNAPTDIAGTTRGASNDIGCWQFVASGGGSTDIVPCYGQITGFGNHSYGIRI